MGLFELRKPKWRHKDPAVRLEAIESIDPHETDLLAELSLEDPVPEVRRAAINRLTDLATLSRVAEKADPDDRPVVTARQDTILADRIVNNPDNDTWYEDLNRIDSARMLARLAVEAEQPDVRLAAVERISDQFLLAEIVKQQCGKKPALTALEKITHEALLADLVECASSKAVRRLAAEKIAEIEQRKNPVSEREIMARQLTALADKAAQLKAEQDMDAAVRELEDIKREWNTLDSEHAHPAHAAFVEICTHIEEKYQEMRERRQADREMTARNERFQARLAEICGIIERLSCSTADDAQDAKEQALADWDRLVAEAKDEMAPSESVGKRFTNACRAFDSNREQIKIEKAQVETVDKQCAGILELIASRDLKKAAGRLEKVTRIMARSEFKFISRTAVEKMVTDVSEELNRVETNLRNENLSRRREICSALEKLAEVENPHHLAREMHALSQDWQQLARLEGAEGEEMEQRFQEMTGELTEKLKTLEHHKDWELWANLTLKEKLTEKVAALDREEDLETVVNVIKQAQAEWKEIGPVPHRESQPLWNKFQNACNRNFERAMPFLEELKNRRIEAMNRRREICVLIAELAESVDWQKTTQAIKGFQEEWKNLPHGSRGEERKLYKQFREACNRFFARRKEHYRLLDKERQQNLIDKEQLCAEAEQLAAAPQIDYPGKFKSLQSRWKKTGPVPLKKKDAVWKRFRAACDRYFDWLAAEQQRNLQRKEELCAAAEKLVAESTPAADQKEIAARLTDLQQQWKETGPVPPDMSEALWQRFREPMDQFFAARQEQYEQEEKQRRLNQGQKEEILARAEEVAGGSRDRETAAQLQELLKQWSEIGPAPREINNELNDRFKSLCDAFFEGRRQYFKDLQEEQLENQKKKESLCLRLENILGLSYDSDQGAKGKALSLAEELKQAMEDNFMLAGRRDEKRDISDEVRRIEQEWKTIGPVPSRQIRPLTERYKKALHAYYQTRRTQRT